MHYWVLESAWFLPVIKQGVTFPKGLPGWEAFRVAFAPVWPFGTVNFDTWWSAALSAASAITTILFLFGAPLVLFCGSRSVWRASAWVAFAAFLIDAHWYVMFGSERSDLRIGYFLWWFSFAALAAGLFELAKHAGAEESA